MNRVNETMQKIAKELREGDMRNDTRGIAIVISLVISNNFEKVIQIL